MSTESSSRAGIPAQQRQADRPVESKAASWSDFHIRDVADAILHTVIYADLFDYPLTAKQIHRFLTGYAAPLATVEEYLASDTKLSTQLDSIPPFWFLSGRDHLVRLRQEREAYAQVLWSAAWRYGHLVATMPFVRLTAVTGSLTMNNATSAQDDVDLLLVTRRGRVWLARGLAILVVHLAARLGFEICPNYVMAEQHLRIGEQNLFTAHELAQLVPLYGLDTYLALMESNAWLNGYLPNFAPRRAGVGQIGRVAQFGQRLAEATLGGRLGDAVERWERERKIPRLRQVAAERGGTGAIYRPDLCKGHADDHGATIQERYVQQLAARRA
jgi:hypothetical protein